MTGRGPYNNAGLEAEESSGVTMAPVPVKPTRLDLDESDRTQYFSITALVERGKAVASRALPPVAPAPSTERPHVTTLPPEPGPKKPGILQQIREASFPRKASAVMLPLLIGLLLFKPLKKNPSPSAADTAETTTAMTTPKAVAAPEPEPQLAATPAEPPPTLPKGMSLERAAADAIAAGDFGRALALYRELSRRQPDNAAYREAARILERRAKDKLP